MFRLFSALRCCAGIILIFGAVGLVLPAPSVAQELSPATQKLFDAVHNGDLSQVQISIAGGGDVDAVDSWGVTPVDLAVDKGHFDIVHFLLQVRELKKTTQKTTTTSATVTSLGETGALQPRSAFPIQPAPLAAPVGGVYSPPPGADPWSATVVTSEPPVPPAPVIPAGPSPFDKKTAVAENSLPIIGTVRGPEAPQPVIDTSIQMAVEDTFQNAVRDKPAPAKSPLPVIQPEPEPALTPSPAPPKVISRSAAETTQPEEESPGVWDNIKSFLKLDSDAQVAATPEAVKEQAPETVAPSKPIAKAPQTVPTAKPTPPVSPPNVTGPPPPIEGKVLPKSVTPAPLSNLVEDDLDAPRVESIQQKLPEHPSKEFKTFAETSSRKAQTAEPRAPVVKVTPVKEPAKDAPKQVASTSVPKESVQIGTTTLPGKPREQKGILSKVMSIFSSSEDERDSDTDSGKSGEATSGDWSVKQIEQARVVPRKPAKKPGRNLPENRLDGVILSIGRTTSLGKEPPPQMPAPWFYRSCVSKKLGSMFFCIEPVDWPDDILPHFLTDSVMYEGARTIVRYDEGSATYFHTLFPSLSFPEVVKFFTRRYGPPSQKLTRSIAPLAEPRRTNPTIIWRSIAPVTNLLTTLEVRQYDDNRGGFPDTKRGAVYLYHEWSQPVFPQLSSVELMLLRAEEKQR